jgi:hypothetical protein
MENPFQKMLGGKPTDRWMLNGTTKEGEKKFLIMTQSELVKYLYACGDDFRFYSVKLLDGKGGGYY